MVIIMTLWIGNGAVPKSSSQLQLKEFKKLNNSSNELFIFKIIIIRRTPKIYRICRELTVEIKFY